MPQVELFELGPDRSVLDELAKELTLRQMAHVERQLRRLEENGRNLGPTYFEKVKTSKRGLSAFRVTADKVEVRLLYRQEGDTFVMLLGFLKKGMFPRTLSPLLTRGGIDGRRETHETSRLARA